MTKRRSAKPKPPAIVPPVRKAKPKPKAKPKAKAKPRVEPRPAEPPADRSDSGLVDAALAGDERKILEAAIKMLAREAEVAPLIRVPTLIKEIRIMARELQKLPDPTKADPIDELKKRRTRRRAKATRP